MPDVFNKTLYNEIQLANQIIAVVKSVLGPFPLNIRGGLAIDNQGDINQFASVWADRTLYQRFSDQQRQVNGGVARLQTRQLAGHVRPGYQNDQPQHRPKVTLAALDNRAVGMCQDYAALTYALLRAYLPTTRSVCYIYEPNIIHYYCTIGDFDNRNVDAGSLIVVDSWYAYADAVLWADSNHRHANYGGNTLYCKFGTNVSGLQNPTDQKARSLIQTARHSYTRFPPTIPQLIERDQLWHSYQFMHDQTQYQKMQYGNFYSNSTNDAHVVYTFIPTCSTCNTHKYGVATDDTKWHHCPACDNYYCSVDGAARSRSGWFSESRVCACGGATVLFT